MMLDYYGGGRTIPTYSYVHLLNGEPVDAEGRGVDAEMALAGKLAFVGFSDPGLTDTFATPFTADRPESRRAGTVEVRKDAAQQIAKEGMQ